MKRLLPLLFLFGGPIYAVPVVPNFSAGSVTSRTESSQSTREIIKSYSYSTGYQYSAGGTNITADGNLSPTNTTVGTQTVNGTTSSWTGIGAVPVYTQTTPGASTNFTQSYSGPGLQNYTLIDRTIELESVTESTSTFTQ